MAAIEKRLGRSVPAMSEELTLPRELQERMAAGGDKYGQQRGGGTSKEVSGGTLACALACVAASWGQQRGALPACEALRLGGYGPVVAVRCRWRSISTPSPPTWRTSRRWSGACSLPTCG
jgi:hypothetical protein